MDKNSFFWLGGIGSFSLYAAVVAILLFALTNSQNLKKIAIKSEQSSIEISMEELEATPSEPVLKTEEKVVPKETKKPEEPKKVEPKKPEKVIEDAVSPKKIVKEIPKKEQPKAVQNTPQKTVTQQPKSAKDLLAALSIKKNSDISFTSFNSSGEVNEYLSNIAKIIKQGWNPAKSDAGLIATVVVNIEPDGSFSFRLKRGGGADFNDRLTAYLQFLQKKGFPPPTDKKSVSVEFNFKARE
jgi:outer membrane biosynthesis protein TonB